MPTSGIYAGKTTFASTIPLSLSLSLSLPRPLHSSRFSVSSTRTGTVSVYRSALSFPSLFFLPFPPAAYRSHSLDLFPSFPPFRSWHEVHEHAGSFFSVPLQALRGMHRSLATPTSVESSSDTVSRAPYPRYLKSQARSNSTQARQEEGGEGETEETSNFSFFHPSRYEVIAW